MNRRSFLVASSASALLPATVSAVGAKRRVAVIGHTGRGNYGHGLDVVWQKIPGAEIVGVADGDAGGLKKAVARLKTKGFKSYREMLEQLKPEFVSVAPRHADQHLDMALATIKTGARGLYVEKPFCRTPAECDELLAASRRSNVKIAVAHRNRYHPVIPIIDKLVTEGRIGRLLELRGHGLGDRRGGGQDLWVLGSHVLNLFHHFGGDPRSCSAMVLQQGKPVTKADVVAGAEGLGPLAGDEVHARWRMDKGVTATYTTFVNDGSNKKGYAAHLVGTKGTISIHIDRDPVAWLSPGNPFDPAFKTEPRIPITTAGPGRKENNPDLVAKVHNHVLAVEDLIEAVDQNREPLCDIREGTTTVEMICAVFESHRQEGRDVPIPLKEHRDNALSRL